MSTVQSIDRCFDILETLALGPSGVSDLAAATDLPKSTVARLLQTLLERQAVEQSPTDSRYRLGPALADLASAVTPSRNLIAVAHPHLADLAKTVGEAAGLSVPDGYDVHYLDQVEAPNPVQVRDWTGERIPMHVVPSGIALMAEWPAQQVARYLARKLARPTRKTVVAAAGMRKKLADCRRDGHAWGFEEFAEGINSVAAIVRTQSGAVAGAIHIHGPAYRFPGEASQPFLASILMDAAARVSDQLGHRPG